MRLRLLSHLQQLYGANLSSFFWQNGPGGLIHHDDFWETISSKVHIHRDEIRSMGESIVHLRSSKDIKCHAVVCGTGWVPSLQFFNNEQLIRLGLPSPLESEPKDVSEHWKELFQEADQEICRRFSLLEHPPKHSRRKIHSTTYRLYRGMAPVNDDSILFMNHINTGNKFLVAEAQASWAVAYFDKRITLPAVDKMEKSIASWVAFSRRRYLSNGQLGNAINFESITYVDTLLEDMGMSAHKKTWWRQWFETFRPCDLGRAWKEYLDRYGPRTADGQLTVIS